MKHSLKIKMAGVAFLALMAVMVAVMVAVSLPRGEPALAQDAGICGRTQQVREAILAKLDGVSGCSDVTAEDLAGITGRLSLENVGLSSLISSDFDGLSRLTQLSISNTEDATKLSALPSGIFDDLTRLQELQLVATDLSELPEGAFDELEALQLLEVTDANLTRLPDGVFDNATALKSIRLSRNNITLLPEGVFDELTNLEILLIERNPLASLPDGIFDEVTALRVLFLSRNNIAVLPEGVLDELSNLEILLIERNQLTSLPDGIFDELPALKALFFYRNDLAELRNGIFDELTSLEQLSFSGKFTSLNAGVFDELTRLKQLQIEESELTSLPSGVFDNLSGLTQLYLGNNALTVLEEGVFDKVPKLTSLYLHQNEFVELPEGMFKGLTELEKLKLQENPGAPFTIYAELEQRGQGVVVKVTEGAPFDMTITLSATGGTLDTTTVAVAGGSLESAVAGVTASGDDLVTVSVESSVFDLADLLGALTAPGSSLTLTSNTPASGAPTISGTVQVGQTLTADVSGIADADGLDNVSFSYQWLSSSDTEIEGATSSTYTLQTSDEGNVITVRVSFTDDAGNEESLTSAATTAVAATVPGAPGSLSVSVNDTGKLDVSWSAPGDNGGTAVSGYRVQWKESDDSWDTPADVSETTVTGTSHTVTGLTDGVEYTFRVFAINRVGDSTASEEESGAPKDTTVPTVSSATVDEAFLLLTFSEGLSQTPLPAVTTFTVNVGDNQRGVNSLAISGSTVNLTLASAVTSTDAVSVSYTVPSDAEAARLKGLSDNSLASFTGQPVTNNTAAAQTPLTASIHDDATSHDGQAEFTFELRFSENLEGFSYKTLRDHAFTVTNGEVKVARRLVRGSNIRWEIKVRPTSNGDVTIVLPITTDCTVSGGVCTGDGRKLSNRLELAVSGPTSQQSQENTPATGAPTISGAAQVRQMLSASTSDIADTDGLTNGAYSYQWVANDGNSDSDIAGATASAYTLVDEDAGKTIKVRVTFTDDTGNDETLTSAPTGAVATKPNTQATGTPTINGTAQVGETLTTDTSGIEDDDGLDAVTFNFQWLAGNAHIGGATRSSYTTAEADEGLVIQVRVTFTDDAGNDEMLTSPATAAVTPKPNTPATGQPSITGTAQVGETLTAETSDMSDTDGLYDASFAYQWLAGNAHIHGATGSTYTLTEDEEGLIVQVRLTFTDDAGHSETLTSEGTESVASSEPESPVEPPPAPQNLVGTVNSDGSVTLTWDAPDDGSITGYQILRRRPTEGENTLLVYVADTKSTATTYTDTNVTAGVQHAYRVKAINAAGAGSVSNFINVTP